ncbi:DUF6542 domain-containing protein [Streptomyces sp. NPDC047017]|uniref:DUF6542 domain-containing protein n=1 Tax=Streptomyces sp. NPDC047017 TaxID=3155024 RepID=UPI0033D01393
MEQDRTRPQQYGPRRGRPPVPAQNAPRRPLSSRRGGQGHERPAGRGPAGARRPPGVSGPRPAVSLSGPATVIRRLRQLPNPRLTGLGCGLFCCALMLVLGCLDALLLGGSPALYGLLFLPVAALTATWVRKGDLLSAPVAVPIGFAVGLVPVADGGGFLGTLMGLVTALATQALWLYGGTLIAGVTALLRRAAAAQVARPPGRPAVPPRARHPR